jgi:hypothetical protein
MCESRAVAEKSATGAPEIEIEITPEMIEAGVEEYLLCEAHDAPEGIVMAVYLAMHRRRDRYS